MHALLICAAVAAANRDIDPRAKAIALADEQRYAENYQPRTAKELAEDAQALKFYGRIMAKVTNWALDDHKPVKSAPVIPPSLRLTLHASSQSSRRSALRIVKELKGPRAAHTAVLVQTPRWTREEEREAFQEELWKVAERAGLQRHLTALGTTTTSARTSRVTESLITELNAAGSAAAALILSLDLVAWTPCRTFAHDFWGALPSLHGDALYVAAAPPVPPS